MPPSTLEIHTPTAVAPTPVPTDGFVCSTALVTGSQTTLFKGTATSLADYGGLPETMCLGQTPISVSGPCPTIVSNFASFEPQKSADTGTIRAPESSTNGPATRRVSDP